MRRRKKEVRKYRGLSKFLVFVIFVLGVLIVFKSNGSLKNEIYDKVFESNFNFAKINELYTKYLGNIMPSDSTSLEKVSATNNFTNVESYKDGAKAFVKEGEALSSKWDGIVVFTGNKEGYGNTIVLQRSDGVEVWYSNLKNLNVQLYDYVKKGTSLGEANGNFIYLVFMKDGKKDDYNKYI